MQHSTYHSLLRVSALTLSLVLLFASGVLSPVTRELTGSTARYLANAISMSASVAPNDYNALSAQIAQKQQELNQREIEVGLKEQSANAGSELPIYILSTLVFILLVLIVLNYALDFIRARKEKQETAHGQMA